MSTGGGTTKTVSTQQLAPEQRKLMDLALPLAKDYASQPLELFPGSTIAGFNPTQMFARQQIAQTAGGPVQDLSNRSLQTVQQLNAGGGAGQAGAVNLLNAGEMGTPALGAILGDYAAGDPSRRFIESGALLDPATNPILSRQTEAAIDPIARRLTEHILPGIRSDFVGGNMFGSSRQGIAERGAVDDFIREAGSISTNLQANNFNQGLAAMVQSLAGGRQAATTATGQALGAGEAGTGSLLDAALQGLQMSPSLASLAFLPGMTMEGLGSSQQQMEQAQLSEQANRFTTQQLLPFLQAQDITNLAMGMGGGSAVTQAQQNPSFNMGGSLMGGLMMAALMPSLGLPSLGGLLGF